MKTPVISSLRDCLSILLALTLSLPTPGLAAPAVAAQPADTGPSGLPTALGAASAETGWLLLEGRLYWTTTAGAAWEDRTPPDLAPAQIAAAHFLEDGSGWLALLAAAPDGEPVFELARTADGGRTWRRAALSLFQAGEPDALAERVALQFIDARTGWLLVERATSRSFSRATLFRTGDGGRTWTRSSLPVSGHLRFASSTVGWLVGGVAGDELYTTADGGRTWRASALDGQLAGRRPLLAPVLSTATNGALPFVEGERLGFLVTADGGQTWAAADNGAANPAGAITDLAAVTPDILWALLTHGRCVPGADCLTEARLGRSLDGGRTWAALALPGGAERLVTRTAAPPEVAPAADAPASLSAALQPRTRTMSGQGFDSCTQPSLAQMQDWITNGPYRVWNLYIGGSSRANCGTLTADYLAQLAVQGWRFIPTWVGPQASCSGFLSRMSADPAVAYNQGVAEANAAVETAARLGLTFADKTGSVLYYDLEAYFPPQGDTACRESARSFMAGWTAQLHARGNLAGVYGSTCRSYLSDFVSNPAVPDVVWPAVWILPYQYRPTVSLFNLACLDNSLWVDRQRLRQYSGGHNETWGATTINIDSNVLDGVVADIRDLDGTTPQAVELYQGGDYTGPAPCIENVVNNFNVTDCGAEWEDQTSSLKVGAGWSVRVYRDANLSGPSVCFVLSDPDLSNDWFDATTRVDNHLSSVSVYANPACLAPWVYLPLVRR